MITTISTHKTRHGLHVKAYILGNEYHNYVEGQNQLTQWARKMEALTFLNCLTRWTTNREYALRATNNLTLENAKIIRELRYNIKAVSGEPTANKFKMIAYHGNKLLGLMPSRDMDMKAKLEAIIEYVNQTVAKL